MSDAIRQNNGGKAILLSESENFKLAQAMYYIVTGKTEKISKAFPGNFKIELGSIDQLNSKLDQMTTQWEILGKNTNITISHSNENEQLFSSMDRFKLYDKSMTSPIESITYNFSFLYKMPEMRCDEKHSSQHYNITVRMMSRVVMYNDKPPSMPLSLLKLFGDSAIVIEIEYVDYNIARTIMATLESWVKEIEQSKDSKLLKYMQKNSSWIPRLIQIGTIVFAISALNKGISIFSSNYSSEEMLKYGLLSTAVIYISTKIGSYLGRFASSEINLLTEISYIKINIGDERSIRKFLNNNTHGVLKTLLSIILSIVQMFSLNDILKFVLNIIK